MSPQSGELTENELGLELDNMHLRLDEGRGVARLTLDNPEKMNRVSMEMRDQISDLFRTLERDGRARVVVMSGAG